MDVGHPVHKKLHKIICFDEKSSRKVKMVKLMTDSFVRRIRDKVEKAVTRNKVVDTRELSTFISRMFNQVSSYNFDLSALAAEGEEESVATITWVVNIAYLRFCFSDIL